MFTRFVTLRQMIDFMGERRGQPPLVANFLT
jgi:hypothetical protein